MTDWPLQELLPKFRKRLANEEEDEGGRNLFRHLYARQNRVVLGVLQMRRDEAQAQKNSGGTWQGARPAEEMVGNW